MNMHNRGTAMRCLSAAVLLAVGGPALANTLNQNVSWTIDRSGTTAKYRIVAYDVRGHGASQVPRRLRDYRLHPLDDSIAGDAAIS